MKRHLLYIVLPAAMGLLLVYWELSPFVHRELIAWFGANAEIPVKVLRVKKVPLSRVIHIDGELQPLNETEIISQLPGVVKEIRYKVGDLVLAGAVVAMIQSKDLTDRLSAIEAAVKDAEEDLRDKEKQFQNAENEFANARELLRRDLIARRVVDDAEEAANLTRAEKDVAQTQLAQRQSMLDQERYLLTLTRLVAPFAGVVTRRWVERDASVSPSTPVLSIAQTEPMRVAVPIMSEDANWLRPGMTVRLRIDDFPDHEIEGKVAQITPAETTPGAATAEVHLFNRDGLLKPGMKAAGLVLPSEAQEVLLVPQECIIDSEGKSYLYTAVAGKAERKAVVKGLQQSGKVVITAGLEEGEFVIIAGVEKLHAGSRVRATE
jgi:RND family efflux transporter MFP subunit